MVATAKQMSDITIFDRELIKQNRQRATSHFADHGFLYQWSKKQLGDRLNDINRTFERSLQIGSRGLLNDHPKINAPTILDITDRPIEHTDSYVQASEDFLPIAPRSMDLILSNLNIHSVNDLPGSLVQIRNSLKGDGLFIASMFGGETLHELRKVISDTELVMFGGISPRVFPFADKPQMGDLLQRAGLALPVVDSEIVTVTYDNAFKLLHDIRGMGESNTIIARDKRYLGKEFFMRVAQSYAEQFSEPDGKIVATFEIIFLLGWAPHSSQQQPLKPGSAQSRLADALGTDEIKMKEDDQND